MLLNGKNCKMRHQKDLKGKCTWEGEHQENTADSSLSKFLP